MRAPDAPIGCPIATAPPNLLITSVVEARDPRADVIATAENASLISHTAMSRGAEPVRSSSFCAAIAGVKQMYGESHAIVA